MGNAFFKKRETAGYAIATALASWFVILGLSGADSADNGSQAPSYTSAISSKAGISSVSAPRSHWHRVGYRWIYETNQKASNAKAHYEGADAFAADTFAAEAAPSRQANVTMADLNEGRWLKIGGRWDFVKADMAAPAAPAAPASTAAISHPDEVLSQASHEKGYWMKQEGHWKYIKTGERERRMAASKLVWPSWMLFASRAGEHNGLKGHYDWQAAGNKGAGRMVFHPDMQLAENGRWIKRDGRWVFADASGAANDASAPAITASIDDDDYAKGHWVKRNGRWVFDNTDHAPAATASIDSASEGRWIKRNGRWVFANDAQAPATTASTQTATTGRWIRRNGRWVFMTTVKSHPQESIERRHWVFRNGIWMLDMADLIEDRINV